MRLNPAVKRERDINRFNPVSSTAKRRLFFCRRTDTKQLIEIPTIYLRQHSTGPAANGGAGPVPSFKNWNPVLARCLALPAVAKLACRHPTLKNTQSIRALFCILLLAIRTSPAAAGSEDLIDVLSPDNEPGRLTLICRFGSEKIFDHLPALIRAVEREGRKVVLTVNPAPDN